jgi:hypothetical protein
LEKFVEEPPRLYLRIRRFSFDEVLRVKFYFAFYSGRENSCGKETFIIPLSISYSY